MATIKNIAVFCGSCEGKEPDYMLNAGLFAQELCNRNLTLIYGGAKIGLMGVLARIMLTNQAQVIGVMPQSLVDLEVANHDISQLHITKNMHERKKRISELADAFVLLPGGIGSLDEFYEMWTWAQIGYHSKPLAVLNTNGYYDKLFDFMQQVVAQEFMSSLQFQRIIIEKEPKLLLDKILHAKPQKINKFNEMGLKAPEEAMTQG